MLLHFLAHLLFLASVNCCVSNFLLPVLFDYYFVVSQTVCSRVCEIILSVSLTTDDVGRPKIVHFRDGWVM